MVTIRMCTYCQVYIVTVIIIFKMLFYNCSITSIACINQYDKRFTVNIVSDKYRVSISHFQNFILVFLIHFYSRSYSAPVIYALYIALA